MLAPKRGQGSNTRNTLSRCASFIQLPGAVGGGRSGDGGSEGCGCGCGIVVAVLVMHCCCSVVDCCCLVLDCCCRVVMVVL